MLCSLGYPVFYSDKEAKSLMTNSLELRQGIIALFGEKAYNKNQLNRKFLAEQIFADSSKIEQMNALVHPAVRNHFKKWAENQKSDIVFNEAAILFETGAHKNFDYTILVVADSETRIERVMTRDGITTKQVEDRMAKQWSDEDKIKLASFIISNNDQDLLIPQLNTILNDLLK